MHLGTNTRASLLVNTQSRRGAALYKAAARALASRGFELSESLAVADPRLLAHATRKALASKPSLLVVGGGDGTVSAVAGHLAYGDTVLGVLPLGTTNNFARSMGLPFDLDSAIDVLETGEVEEVDLGRIGERFFGNVASIGLSVEVARSASASLKQRMGRLAYAFEGARQLGGHQPFTATVSTKDGRRGFRTHQLVIANGGFHGGRQIARDAGVGDCQLTIFPIGGPARTSAVSGMLSFEYGRARSVHDGQFISTAEAVIETEPVRDIEVDGEILATTPTTVAIACKALRAMAPRSCGI